MYNQLNQYLLLFQDCVIVDGYKKSVIFDFSRPDSSNFIPASFSEFVARCKKNTLQEILEVSSETDKEIIKEYVEFIIENEFGFFCSKLLKDSFIPFADSLKESPEIIDNCILELSPSNLSELPKIVSILDHLLVSSLELWVDSLTNKLEEIINCFSGSIIQSINMYCSNTDEFNLTDFVQIKNKNKRVKKMCLYGLSVNQSYEEHNIHCFNHSFDSVRQGKAKIINLSFHLEAKYVNTFLFKKLFIGANGDIKNYPDGNNIYGNIYHNGVDEIIEIVQSAEFRTNWFLPKSNISVCGDCEFRTVCFSTDVPTQNTKGEYFYEKQCSYNPYIGKEKGEPNYRSLQECGVISNGKGFYVDHERINRINKELEELEGE